MMLACKLENQRGIYHITEHALSPSANWLNPLLMRFDVPLPAANTQAISLSGANGLELIGMNGIPVPLSRTGVAFFSENRRSTYQRGERRIGVSTTNRPRGVQRSVDWYRAQGLL
ncbi:MAG: hypothetical protein R3E31_23240 [Chloroflexota bacterium]